MEKLKILALAEGWIVEQENWGDDSYIVKSRDSDTDVLAVISSSREVRYYQTGRDNWGLRCLWKEIFMDELLKLRDFCEELIKE